MFHYLKRVSIGLRARRAERALHELPDYILKDNLLEELPVPLVESAAILGRDEHARERRRGLPDRIHRGGNGSLSRAREDGADPLSRQRAGRGSNVEDFMRSAPRVV